MLNISIFRLIFLSAPFVLAVDAWAMEKGELGDTNPFLELQSDSQIEPSGVVSYDFNSSPNAISNLDLSRTHIEESRKTTTNGFVLVQSSRVRDFDRVVSGYRDANAELQSKFASEKQIKAPKKIPQKVAFKQTKLNLIEDDGMVKILDVPRGDYYPDKGWDASVRAYKGKEGILIISEWDYSISNGGVIIDDAAINIHVQNNPGILTVRVDDKGRSETVLFWADDERAYTIEANQNLGTSNGRQWLELIARQLTSSS